MTNLTRKMLALTMLVAGTVVASIDARAQGTTGTPIGTTAGSTAGTTSGTTAGGSTTGTTAGTTAGSTSGATGTTSGRNPSDPSDDIDNAEVTDRPRPLQQDENDPYDEWDQTYEMIKYLATSGNTQASIDMEKALREGRIQVDPNLEQTAEWRNNILYVNPNLFQSDATNTGTTPMQREAQAARFFASRMWLASILMHEWNHLTHGENYGTNFFSELLTERYRRAEIRAWEFQIDWLRQMLLRTDLTPSQRELLQGKIDNARDIANSYKKPGEPLALLKRRTNIQGSTH